MKLGNCVYDERKRGKVSENVKCFFYNSEKQFVLLDMSGFKLVGGMLPVTVSQGLLIWGGVD